MIYVFEGLPGSYKSSVINELIKRNPSFVNVKEILDCVEGDENDFNYYITNDKMKSKTLLSQKNKDVVLVDRYWHSTVLYHSASMNPTNYPDIKKCFKEIYGAQLFDEYYFVYMKIDCKRSHEKSKTHDIDSNWLNYDFLQTMHSFYEKMYDNISELNRRLLGKIKIDMNVTSVTEAVKLLEDVIAENEK